MLGEQSPVRTQSVYHALGQLMEKNRPDTIVLTFPEGPYLCVGYHQAIDDILDQEACNRRGLPVIRRLIGGGTTYLDSNQLFYQFIFHKSRVPAVPSNMYSYLLEVPYQTLLKSNFNAQLFNDHEINISGKRIAGIGGGWIEESAVVVGNFLFDFDYDAIINVWYSPWPSFRTLAAKSLRDNLTSLWAHQSNCTMDEITEAFIQSIGPALNRDYTIGRLDDDELERALQLDSELVAEHHLRKFTSDPSKAHPPLKISAGTFIHGETHTVNGNAWRGSFVVQQHIIEQSIIEKYAHEQWSRVNHDLTGIPLSDWPSKVEHIHA